MSYQQKEWQRLLAALADVGPVEEPAPGRIRVRRDSRNPVEIVMTPDDWSAMSGTVWGDVSGATAFVLEKARNAETPYLVFELYELVPSETPELPEDPQDARMRELMRQHPNGIPGGRWLAHPPES